MAFLIKFFYMYYVVFANSGRYKLHQLNCVCSIDKICSVLHNVGLEAECGF